MKGLAMQWDIDRKAWGADAYRIDGWAEGVAWRVLGWETEIRFLQCDPADCPEGEAYWESEEKRTGKVVAVMIGDDKHFSIDPAEVTPIDRLDFCGECGQIGCGHDGLEREAVQS